MVSFRDMHKVNETDFTRSRKLPFVSVFILIIKNSVKSLQCMLNEFVLTNNLDYTVTSGAFTKARKKLRHGAFVELNEGLTEIYYKSDDIKKFNGLRIIAFDGSNIILPNEDEVREEFGTTRTANGTYEEIGSYSRATLVAGYDVLNNMVVSATLGHSKDHELTLATNMIANTKEDDLLVYDRGFGSYMFMATLIKNKRKFVIRLSKASFGPAKSMFKDAAPDSRIVSIQVPNAHRKAARDLGLDEFINIRLVRVVLSTGEIEVLATVLFDTTKYPNSVFKELYNLRWGVETFFGKIKGRLNLENFTGKTVEAIKQDFWATIMISNLETIMTEDIDKQINSNIAHKQQCNESAKNGSKKLSGKCNVTGDSSCQMAGDILPDLKGCMIRPNSTDNTIDIPDDKVDGSQKKTYIDHSVAPLKERVNHPKVEPLMQKINKAVSFNAIKNLAFELLAGNEDQNIIILKLEKLFKMNTLVVRSERNTPRDKISQTRSRNYQKRKRKHVF